MEDRELLELAAKAAGYCVDTAFDDGPLIYGGDDGTREWNPLEDDGDAMRLAVKLSLHVEIDYDETPAEVRVYGPWLNDNLAGIYEDGQDPYAATRRAIVRAAAEIGKMNSV